MSTYKVGYLIGSLSSTSINRKLAKALVKLAPPSLEFVEITFKELPVYSPDFDADYPPAAREFKAAISAVDAVIFVAAMIAGIAITRFARQLATRPLETRKAAS